MEGFLFLVIITFLGYIFILKPFIIKPFSEGLHGKNESKNATNPNEKSKQQKSKDDNKAKGDLFEQFIVKKFDRTHFTILEWRGDKYIDGQYAIANLNPDLEVQFEVKGVVKKFAVECKFRQQRQNETIEIAKERQIIHYKNFERESKLDVYIALGIGGKPDLPNELYLIPLKEINSHILNNKDIKNFKRSTQSQFYYDRFEDILM